MTAKPPERTVPIACPGCGSENTGRMQAGVVEADKVDGDVAICFYCSAFGIYVGTPPTALREPTDEEMAELKADSEIQRMLTDLTLFRIAQGMPPA